MDTHQIIRENLKNWMAESTTLRSQTAIAAKAKVGQSHVSRILRGESNPTIEMLESIAGAFRRSLTDILTKPTSPSMTVEEPRATYDLKKNIIPIPKSNSPEVAEILNLIEAMSEKGHVMLLTHARNVIKEYPKAKANRAK